MTTDYNPCPMCLGTGDCEACDGRGTAGWVGGEDCEVCAGSGVCTECNGSGVDSHSDD